MGVITVTDYKSLAADYESALGQLTGISDKYFDAAYTVVQLQTFDPEIDLLIPFFNAYQTSEQAYKNSPQSIVEAVRALQNHVLARGKSKGFGAGQTLDARYNDIDQYYSDESANPANLNAYDAGSGVLGAEFATVSSQAGHTIDAIYVA